MSWSKPYRKEVYTPLLDKPKSCMGCPLWQGGKGWVPASGSGKNGVLVVLEAAGKDEAESGVPTVGKAGHYLWSNVARVGLDREDFRIHNVLSCRPPDNKLAKMSYEQEAIDKCSPNLLETIAAMRDQCAKQGTGFVILAMGRIAFRTLMGLKDKDPLLKNDYLNYPFWSETHKAWILGADHPSYIMRGNHHLVPVMQFAFTRAVEIASQPDFRLESPEYILDPSPEAFASWAEGYERVLKADSGTLLSYDIETPFKQSMDEEQLSKEEDDDYTIIRCSFAYRAGDAVSVPWQAPWIPTLERLFASSGTKVGWNNDNYDAPRVCAQMPILGQSLDGMLAWHVLNSALPKGLGFVTPFYAQSVSMWKHLSQAEPAFYNAKDADMALRNVLGILQGLRENSQGAMFDRHVIQVNKVFSFMSEQGVLRDEIARKNGEQVVSEALAKVEIDIQNVVPLEAKELKVYVKTPKVLDGLVQVERDVNVTRCCKCLIENPKADHFKSKRRKVCSVCGEKYSKRAHSHGEPLEVELSPCVGAGKCITPERRLKYARALPFALSNVALQRYQAVRKHKPVMTRVKPGETPRVTFDKGALITLIARYPKDPLYSLIPQQRSYQKLLSNYIGVTQSDGSVRGGLPVGADGKIHTRFTHNPSTLRSASQQPNLQNLPRPNPNDPDAYENIIRNQIVAAPGNILYARDYSGIEAVLVGYFARSPRYIRLAKLDVHSFYTAYALNQLDGRVKSSDLPDANWPDERLIPHLAWLKKTYKHDRNSLYKHLVHGANFMQGAKGAKDKIHETTGVEFQQKLVQRVMDIYFELFPEIRKWHHELLLQASDDGYLRNPFSYIHRFFKVFDWKKEGGQWTKEPGPQANEVIAFLPQSTAAGIIKEALLRLFLDRFDEAGRYIRLLVHDEIFAECPESEVETLDRIMKEEMEKPIPELPMPDNWGLGSHLVILTEEKKGQRWGQME